MIHATGLPQSSWDVWAEEEQDVWEWLGPDHFDVEWIPGEAPTDAVKQLLTAAGVDWFMQCVSAAGIEVWLHDADVQLSEVELVGTVAVVPGMSDALLNLQPERARGSRVGLNPFVVMIDPAEHVEVDDEQRIDALMVGYLHWEPASRMLTITSPIPGQVVRVRTGARFYYLASGREPALVRRWAGGNRPIPVPTTRVSS